MLTASDELITDKDKDDLIAWVDAVLDMLPPDKQDSFLEALASVAGVPVPQLP